MVNEARGTGKTTRAMQAAPLGAHFVWVNKYTSYARSLATHIGRSDLKVVSPEWARSYARGLAPGALVFDPDASA